ncbi:MAG TPA: type II toxin-antitoxin system Phd/YefM family antitoxin [Candidatus Dormibacteraeota bacterium]|nr:type II toxin-antitoxin system Phd/YefM family antitoxin [Candidatus Dormibacteraeota bacterium]
MAGAQAPVTRLVSEYEGCLLLPSCGKLYRILGRNRGWKELEGLMATIDTDDLISVTEASKLGLSRLLSDAEHGHDRVVLRNNRPVAAVVNMDRLTELERLSDDLADVSLLAARLVLATPHRFSLDEVLDKFGFSREELRKAKS